MLRMILHQSLVSVFGQVLMIGYKITYVSKGKRQEIVSLDKVLSFSLAHLGPLCLFCF